MKTKAESEISTLQAIAEFHNKTHKVCAVTSKLIQIASRAELRKFCTENKKSFERPSYFTPNDEWEV